MYPEHNRDNESVAEALLPGKAYYYCLNAESSLILTTSGGKPVATLRPYQTGVVLTHGSERIIMNGLSMIELGANSNKNFFGASGKYVSGRHVEIAITKVMDGKVSVRLIDLNSTNGTVCHQKNTVLIDFANTPTMPPGKIEEISSVVRASMSAAPKHTEKTLVAGGMQGELISSSGTSRGLTLAANRHNNEDGFLVLDQSIAVADGMGGYEAGEDAAKIALETTRNFISQPRHDIRSIFYAIGENIQKANLPPHCGTTLAMARKIQLENGKIQLELSHAGDTKILVISKKDRRIVYESTDHSRVQDMIQRKILDPIDRYSHSDNNIVTNSIHASGLAFLPSLKTIEAASDELVIVIYTDGVADYVSPEEAQLLFFELYDMSAQKAREEYTLALSRLALGRQKRLDGYKLKLADKIHHVQLKEDGGDNITVAMME